MHKRVPACNCPQYPCPTFTTLGTSKNLNKLWICKERLETTRRVGHRKSNHLPYFHLKKNPNYASKHSSSSFLPGDQHKLWSNADAWQTLRSRGWSSHRLRSSEKVLWAQIRNTLGELNEKLFLRTIGSWWQVQGFWRELLWGNMQTALTRAYFFCLCLQNNPD